MKKLFTLAALLSMGTAFAQTENVGIGTAQPDKSAILDLSSSNKGFLLPRMSEEQRLKIETPAQGLQVYQTDGKAGLYVFNGKDWTNAANSVAAATDPWLRGGNSILPGEFLGTNNFEPLVLKAGGSTVATFRPELSGSLFLGRNAGAVNTGVYNLGVGVGSLANNTTGTYNMGIGTSALETNVSGVNNSAIGVAAALFTTGSDNVAIGSSAAAGVGNGSGNVAIGSESMKGTNVYTSQPRSFNTAIGYQSLRDNITGNSNVAIGYQAGFSETGDNKLYIANSSTATPLIYGDFAAKYVTIGDISPALRTQGHSSLSGGYNLLVKGGILTEKIKVALAQAGTDWADYVFEDDYKKNMLTLEEIEAFTVKHKHLPNVPSAEEMVTNGLDVSQTSKMFMEKIEELTLYIIELNKRIKELESKK